MIEDRFGRLTDPPTTFLLVGVRVIDPNDGTDTVRDLAVLDGFLAEPAALPRNTERIDAEDLVAAPGFCDLHAHLREPGDEGAETMASGTRAAARGGFTTVCAMPNTDPPLDEPARIAWAAERARKAGGCRVRIIGTVTRGRSGDSLAELAGMAEAGAVGFSDDGAAIPSPRLARAALAYLRGLGLPLIEHAEDASLAAGGVMRSGPTADRLGLPGWSPSAELTVVERDIALAAETGARLHLTHLSTASAVEAVGRARARGLPVTCDVTPHHLAMTDEWVAGSRHFAWQEPASAAIDADRAYDGACRVNPPLPLREDALALLAGLADGTVDAIATDHAPHPSERKLVPFDESAPGMIGLETALSLALAAVDAGHLELPALVAALSTRPAEIIGERRSLAIGQPADLVVFEPGARWRVERPALASASANTPLLGMELPGVVRLTVADGRLTYRS